MTLLKFLIQSCPSQSAVITQGYMDSVFIEFNCNLNLTLQFLYINCYPLLHPCICVRLCVCTYTQDDLRRQFFRKEKDYLSFLHPKYLEVNRNIYYNLKGFLYFHVSAKTMSTYQCYRFSSCDNSLMMSLSLILAIMYSGVLLTLDTKTKILSLR